MPKVKILLTRIFPPIAADLLRKEGFQVTQWPLDRPMTPEELRAAAKENDAILCSITDKIDGSFFHECSHLKIISQFAVGYDNINVAEATRLNIPVGNTPGVLTDATADIAFALMLAVSRKMFYLHKTILDGEWKYFRPTKHLGTELKKKTLGIFGLGRIGLEMAKRCKGAFEMDIIYCNRKANSVAEKMLGCRLVSFEDLLAQSDVLSVHSSLTEETRGIFNAAAFSRMKRSAIFINTSRGPVHNEPDLIAALQSGHIWGAGLDVTNPEPMSMDNPLLSMENVAVLPHVASGTVEARGEMARLAAVNIIEFYRMGTVPHLVNPDYSKLIQ